MRKRVIVVLAILLMPLISAAVGVSPAGYSADFTPSLKKSFGFYFTLDPGVKGEAFIEGDLAQYATLSRKSLEGPGDVEVILSLPRDIELPGVHTLFVGIGQLRDSRQQGVALVGNVKGTIRIRVPYPGKYAVASLEAKDTKAGDPVEFKALITNLGKEDIAAKSDISIYDGRNKSIKNIELPITPIESTKTIEIPYSFDTKEYGAGRYLSKLKVEYGGKNSAEAEISFRLGELFVNLISTTRELTRNTINKFDIVIESNWNDPLENVYANVRIPEYNINFPTPSVNLAGFQSAVLTGFFDTGGIPDNVKSLKVNVQINYAGKTTEEIVTVKFKRENNYLIVGLIIGIIVLVAIIIALVWWMRKISKKEKRRKG